MNFIYDVDLILTNLGGNSNLVNKTSYIVNRIIGSSIKFMYIK